MARRMQVKPVKALLIAAACLVLSLPAISHAEAMRFRTPAEDQVSRLARFALDGGQHQIFASGEVEIGSAQQLRDFVAAEDIRWAKIIFDSPGGSLVGGLLLGEAIRQLGFDTEVASEGTGAPGICASACAYAFAGGLNRFYFEGGRLGLHQFYGANGNLADVGATQEVSATIIGYLGSMGVNSSAFIRASGARPEEMVWLEVSDALDMGLANNGVLPTTSEIKLAGMAPYLRIEQISHQVTSRLLLMCEDSQIHGMFGIVTDPDITNIRYHGAIKSYLSFDGEDRMHEDGHDTLLAADSTLWLTRSFDHSNLTLLTSTRTLDAWIENGGAFSWGGGIDLTPVQDEVSSFVTSCLRS